MVLLTLKRFIGTRHISVVDIPRYMDEMDELEDIHFGRKRIGDAKEKAKLTGLYRYCWFMKPPQNPTLHVPYNLLTSLAKVAPEGSESDFIVDKLRNYRYVSEKVSADLETRIQYALSWVRDFEEMTELSVELSPDERVAVEQLVGVLRTADNADDIQSAVFEIARNNGIKPKMFFRTLYSILLGTQSGPRLGPYLLDMGRENAIEVLKGSLEWPKKHLAA